MERHYELKFNINWRMKIVYDDKAVAAYGVVCTSVMVRCSIQTLCPYLTTDESILLIHVQNTQLLNSLVIHCNSIPSILQERSFTNNLSCCITQNALLKSI